MKSTLAPLSHMHTPARPSPRFPSDAHTPLREASSAAGADGGAGAGAGAGAGGGAGPGGVEWVNPQSISRELAASARLGSPVRVAVQEEEDTDSDLDNLLSTDSYVHIVMRHQIILLKP